MAVLASAGVRYEDWLRYAGPLYLGLVALGLVAIAVGAGVRGRGAVHLASCSDYEETS